MRSHTIGVVVLAAIAVVPASRGQDDNGQKDEAPKLPFNPWATAKVGDWSVYVTTFKGEGAPNVKPILSQIVDKVEDDKATVTASDTGIDGKPTKKATVHDMKSLSFADYAPSAKNGPALKVVKIEDDKRTVDGKEFACTKVSAVVGTHKTAAPSEKGPDLKLCFWFSKDVKGGGLVATETTIKRPNGEVVMTMEVKGFGSKGRTEWGKSIADVNGKKDSSDEKKGDEKK
jgi:hypothetical protein